MSLAGATLERQELPHSGHSPAPPGTAQEGVNRSFADTPVGTTGLLGGRTRRGPDLPEPTEVAQAREDLPAPMPVAQHEE
jgi:hypothetical protein